MLVHSTPAKMQGHGVPLPRMTYQQLQRPLALFLGSVAAPDLSYEEAQAMLRESLVTLPGFDENIRECGLSVLEASQFQFWEFSQDLAMPRLLFWKSMSTSWPLAAWRRPLAALQSWAHPLT